MSLSRGWLLFFLIFCWRRTIQALAKRLLLASQRQCDSLQQAASAIQKLAEKLEKTPACQEASILENYAAGRRVLLTEPIERISAEARFCGTQLTTHLSYNRMISGEGSSLKRIVSDIRFLKDSLIKQIMKS